MKRDESAFIVTSIRFYVKDNKQEVDTLHSYGEEKYMHVIVYFETISNFATPYNHRQMF
jgi:hypothetical protein